MPTESDRIIALKVRAFRRYERRLYRYDIWHPLVRQAAHLLAELMKLLGVLLWTLALCLESSSRLR